MGPNFTLTLVRLQNIDREGKDLEAEVKQLMQKVTSLVASSTDGNWKKAREEI